MQFNFPQVALGVIVASTAFAAYGLIKIVQVSRNKAERRAV